jgi:hypothetical protein
MPGWPAAPGCSPSRRSRPTPLIDLESLGWPALTATADGLEIAATCKVVDLHDFKGPVEWRAVPLFRDCIDAFLMSFKIWNAATVGGNICMSLPAGAMISLTAALEGVCTLWPIDRQAPRVPVVDFVTGVHTYVLQKGEAAALDPSAGVGAAKACRHAPGVAHALRPVGGADRRQRSTTTARLPADRQRRHAAAGA